MNTLGPPGVSRRLCRQATVAEHAHRYRACMLSDSEGCQHRPHSNVVILQRSGRAVLVVRICDWVRIPRFGVDAIEESPC